MPDAPLSLDQVTQAYGMAKAKYPEVFSNMDIPQFSTYMNQSLGTDRYRIGEHGLVARSFMRASNVLDEALKPVAETTGNIGESIGSFFGETPARVGRSVGESIPRTALELGAIAGGAAIGGPPGAALAGLGVTSAGSHTLAETGSLPAAAVTAGTFALAPQLEALGGKAAVKYLTPKLEQFLGKNIPRVTEGLTREAGGQAGLLAGQEVGRQASSLVQGQGFAPITPESLGEEAAFNIPFLPFAIPRLTRGYKLNLEGAKPAIEQASFRDIVQPRDQQFFPTQTLATEAIRRMQSEAQAAATDLTTQANQAKQAKVATAAKPVLTAQTPEEAAAVAEEFLGPPKTKEMVAQPGGKPPIEQFQLPLGEQAPAPEEKPPGLKPLTDLIPTKKLTINRRAAEELYNKLIESGVTTAKITRVNDEMYRVEWSQPEPKATFLPPQLMGNTFGTVAAEQLNAEKPFGLAKLPGDFLPGNSLLEKLPKVLPKEEWDILQRGGVESFLKGKRVSIPELQDWVQKNGPQVEVKTIQSGESVRGTLGDQNLQLSNASARHELETLGYHFVTDMGDGHFGLEKDGQPVFPEQQSDRVKELYQVMVHTTRHIEAHAGEPGAFDPDIYRHVAPKNADQVVGLVRVPQKDLGQNPDYSNPNLLPHYATPQGYRESPQFQGHHFGPEDKNVLAFFRGQWETTPDGKKVFHVFEVQSDWGQRLAKEKAKEERILRDPNYNPTHIEQIAEHPLLSDTNRLALKSAVKYAIDNGADAIAISDAETAMMTEGHDLAATTPLNPAYAKIGEWVIETANRNVRTERFPTEAEAKQYASTMDKTRLGTGWKIRQITKEDITPQISQEQGMRLNYDQSLPSIAKDLTGYGGEEVNFGQSQRANQGSQYGIGSNVFFEKGTKNPKTSVTAQMFPLDKAKAELLRRGGYTIFGRDRVVSEVKKLESEGSTTEALAKATREMTNLVVRPGETVSDAAAREVGLPEILSKETSPAEFVVGVHRFFDRVFTLRGEEGPRKDYLVRTAMQLAARTEKLAGRARLAEVLEGPSFHAPGRDEKFNAIIGLRTTRVVKGELDNLRILWDLPHEAMHQIEADIVANPQIVTQSPTHQAYQNSFQSSKGLTAVEKDSVIKTLIRHAMPNANGAFDYKSAVYKAGMTPEMEASEFLADYAGLLALSASSDKAKTDMQDYWKFSNNETQNFVGSFMKDLTQAWSAVHGLLETQLKSAGISDERTRLVISSVKEIHDNLTEIMKVNDQVEAGVSSLEGWGDRLNSSVLDEPPVASFNQVTRMFKLLGQPGVWVKKSDVPSDVVDEASRQMLPTDKPEIGGVRARWWERWLPMTQFARLVNNRWYKDGVDLVQQVQAIASNASMKMWEPFVDKDGKWDAKRAERMGDMRRVDAQAFSYIDLLQQTEERQILGTELRGILKDKYPTLTEDQVKEIEQTLKDTSYSSINAQQLIEQAHRDTLGYTVARIIQQRVPGMEPQIAKRLGLEIGNLALDAQGLNAQQIIQSSNEIRAKVGNDKAFMDGMQHAEGLAKTINSTLETLKNRPWFNSEVRPGKWLVVWKEKDGTRHVEASNTQADAQKRVDAIQEKVRKGEAEYVKAYNKLDQKERYRGLPAQTIKSYIDLDKQMLDATITRLKEGGADAETLNKLQEEFAPGDGALRIWTPPYMLERQHVAGREELNMMEQRFNYIASVAYGTARRYTRQMVDLIQNHPNLKTENPWLRNSLSRFATEMLDSGSREWTGLKNFIFLNTLAFNFSSNLVNLTQNFMVGAPLLIKYGATFGQAYKYLLNAASELGQAHMEAKSLKGPKFADDDIGDIVDRAERDRIVDKGQVAELFALDDALAITRRNLVSGNGKVSDAAATLQNGLYHFMRFARNSYGHSEQFNQRAAVIAGYRFAKEVLGLGREEAYNFATNFTKEGNFGGGKYNRPEILNGLGRGYGIAGAMYSMSGYTFNLLGVYARLAKDAFIKAKGGQLNSNESKALATMVATQALMGGVMGLPLVSGLIAVAEQLFPDVEIKKNLREVFNKLGGQDTEMGHLMADVGMSGIFNAGPVDVGSRFQIGTFMGVDPYKGFSWANLAGPAGGMIDNIVKSAQLGSTGDLPNAFEKLMPSGVRGLWRMATEQGGFRDQQGKLIVDPTATEQIATVAGFRPKRLNQAYEEQALKLKSEQIANRAREHLYSDLADKLMAGQTEAVRRGLIQEAIDEHQAGGFFDPTEGLKKVVEVVQARTLPADPFRTGARANVQQRAEISKLYQQPIGRPTETQLYLQRLALERQVPLPGAGVPELGKLRESNLVDQLLQSNPNLTVAEAKLLIQRTMTRAGGRVAGLIGQ